MTEASKVTEGQCDTRMSAVFDRIGKSEGKVITELTEVRLGFVAVTTEMKTTRRNVNVAIAVAMLAVAAFGFINSWIGKKKSHISTIETRKSADEFAALKVEIKNKVIEIMPEYLSTFKFPAPASRSRNYLLENDGTIFIEYDGKRRATNHWRSDYEWLWFREDLKQGLFDKIVAALDNVNPT